MSLIVAKFGGTSMGTSTSIQATAKIILQNKQRQVVVVSALSGVTNLLVAIGESANKGLNTTAQLKKLRERHQQLIKELNLNLTLDNYFSDLENFLSGLKKIKEFSTRSRDYILSFGERISSEILTAYLQDKCSSMRIDAKNIIKTDSCNPTQPNMKKTGLAVKKIIKPLLNQGKILIITGFIGGNEKNDYVTFSRGGSDFSAAILANVLNADCLEIWTDVNGIMNADPRIIKTAKTIPQMGYKEAAELSYFGAKVLHPKTIEPAALKNIPVKVLNTFQASHHGTLISNVTKNSLKSVTYRNDTTIINLYSTEMLDAKGFIAKIADIFAKHDSSIDVVSTSEVCVSITIKGAPAKELIAELKRHATVEIRADQAVVCLVGEGVQNINQAPAQLFTAIQKYPIRMISQGASPRNITLVVDTCDAQQIVKKIYQKFFKK